jgi:hypothetical protein
MYLVLFPDASRPRMRTIVSLLVLIQTCTSE